jgi:hypothetical protein
VFYTEQCSGLLGKIICNRSKTRPSLLFCTYTAPIQCAATGRTPNIPSAPLRCTGTRSSHHYPDRARYGSPELLGSHVRSASRSWDLVCKLLCKVPCRHAVRGEWCPYDRQLRARTRLQWSVMTAQAVAAWIVQGGCRAWLLVRADAPTSELIQHLGERAECLASAVTSKSMATSRSNLCTHASR